MPASGSRNTKIVKRINKNEKKAIRYGARFVLFPIIDKTDKISPPTESKTHNRNANHGLYITILSKPVDKNNKI